MVQKQYQPFFLSAFLPVKIQDTKTHVSQLWLKIYGMSHSFDVLHFHSAKYARVLFHKDSLVAGFS